MVSKINILLLEKHMEMSKILQKRDSKLDYIKTCIRAQRNYKEELRWTPIDMLTMTQIHTLMNKNILKNDSQDIYVWVDEKSPKLWQDFKEVIFTTIISKDAEAKTRILSDRDYINSFIAGSPRIEKRERYALGQWHRIMDTVELTDVELQRGENYYNAELFYSEFDQYKETEQD